jgi:hypothetical protein
MAKKASGKAGGAKAKKVPAKRSGRASNSTAGSSTSEAFVSLLQSPLVADLVAVAATSALAALAQEGFSREGAGGKRAGKAVKQAGKAAADAVKRRLTEEIDAIKKAAKDAKAAKA